MELSSLIRWRDLLKEQLRSSSCLEEFEFNFTTLNTAREKRCRAVLGLPKGNPLCNCVVCKGNRQNKNQSPQQCVHCQGLPGLTER